MAHIAKLEETIRRLSDENAALRDMLRAFVDHEVDYMRLNHLGDPMMEPRIKYAHSAIYETPRAPLAAIYGTDFPECPDASMHQPVEAPERPTALVTRWRNGKRYELTPADAKLFDEGEE